MFLQRELRCQEEIKSIAQLGKITIIVEEIAAVIYCKYWQSWGIGDEPDAKPSSTKSAELLVTQIKKQQIEGYVAVESRLPDWFRDSNWYFRSKSTNALHTGTIQQHDADFSEVEVVCAFQAVADLGTGTIFKTIEYLEVKIEYEEKYEWAWSDLSR